MEKGNTTEDSVCCKLCSEIFEEPLILLCGHSICKKCAESSLAFNRLRKSNFDKTKQVIHFWLFVIFLESQTEIKCPTCSQSTAIPNEKDIGEALKVNYDLREVIQLMTKRGLSFVIS